MTSSAERRTPSMLEDFLGFTLAGERPNAAEAAGECAAGLCYVWLGDGVLQLEPLWAAESAGSEEGASSTTTAALGAATDPASSAASSAGISAGISAARSAATSAATSVLLSAGVHGDETAPIELLSRLVADLAHGALPLACRLLVVLGNFEAMRAACRYIDDDLNRLFCGRHAELPTSREAPRAAALEAVAARFFDGAAPDAHARWHLDMHTAIRASVFEQFALLPYTGEPPSRAMFGWLANARIAAVLIHTAKGNTYAHFTAERFGATSCTLELGKVRPFGQNDLSRFAAADQAVRALISDTSDTRESAPVPMPRVFTVVDQITKHTEAFVLDMAQDIPNFTAFSKGKVLARDGSYRYVVQHDEERVVFPNPAVKPGLRAGLMVIETTRETLAELAAAVARADPTAP